MKVRCELEIVDGVEEALEVGALVGQRGFGQLKEALLDRGPKDHLPTDTDR